MKQKIKKVLWLAAACCMVSLSSCKKEETGSLENGTMSYKLDGTAISYPAFSYTQPAFSVQLPSFTVGPLENKDHQPRLTLVFPTTVTEGQVLTVDIKSDVKAFFSVWINGMGYQPTSSGTITITELNKATKTIKGTFTLNAEATEFTPAYAITEGSFTCSPYDDEGYPIQ